jgi:UDP-N-acetylglucosamine 2-epimerase (non-hydrolysing)
MKIAVIIGTRPEIIKMSPVIRELENQGLNYFILHTGQHYSYNMDKVFFEQLELPEPKYNLKIGSGTHAEQTGKMRIRIEKILQKEKPNIILVEGDTNTVLSAALVASKLMIKVGHVEAGLRSYDRSMPEEINRVITDHVSDYLFAPTKKAKQNLLNEGIPKEKIFITGNTIVDAVYQYLELTKNNSILEKLELKPNEYMLLTLHRQENVDTEQKLKSIIKGVKLVAKKLGTKIIFPIHPRTQQRIKKFGIKITKEICLIPPQDYLSFLKLEANARLILTDSGGVQEEACILKVPCVTLRYNTERPETIEVGANTIAGTKPQAILKKSREMLKKERNWKNPFGEGVASRRIVKVLLTNTLRS